MTDLFTFETILKVAKEEFEISNYVSTQCLSDLYMARLISYPRTSTNFLPIILYAERQGIFDYILNLNRHETGFTPFLLQADVDYQGSCWVENLKFDHHAIIPLDSYLFFHETYNPLDNLTPQALSIYKKIRDSFVHQFIPGH